MLVAQPSCAKSGGSLFACSDQVDVSMRSQRLLRLDSNKSAVSLVQVDSQDFPSTTLLQFLATTCSKSANIKLHLDVFRPNPFRDKHVSRPYCGTVYSSQ